MLCLQSILLECYRLAFIVATEPVAEVLAVPEAGEAADVHEAGGGACDGCSLIPLVLCSQSSSIASSHTWKEGSNEIYYMYLNRSSTDGW